MKSEKAEKYWIFIYEMICAMTSITFVVGTLQPHFRRSVSEQIPVEHIQQNIVEYLKR